MSHCSFHWRSSSSPFKMWKANFDFLFSSHLHNHAGCRCILIPFGFAVWSWSGYAISNDLKRAMQNGVLALEKEAVAMSKNNSSISNNFSQVLKVTHSRSHLNASQLKDLFRPQRIELVPAGGSGLSSFQPFSPLYSLPLKILLWRAWSMCSG